MVPLGGHPSGDIVDGAYPAALVGAAAVLDDHGGQVTFALRIPEGTNLVQPAQPHQDDDGGIGLGGPEQINALIVNCALEYGHVVRLKGGDPFVFGRGQEEIAYAEAHGIPTTVVPGISSCISLPELQGVAPTSRGYADSFWVLTAHTRDGGISQDLFRAARSNATVIILMGMGRLDQICALWDAEGKGDLPAMVIQNGSLPDERCWVGTVNDIAGRVAAERDRGPGLIVLGATVAQHPNLRGELAHRNLLTV